MKRALRTSIAIVAPALVVVSVLFLLLDANEPGFDKNFSKRDIARLQRRLDALKPKNQYIVIDTGANRLWLRRADKIILEAKCSTGSGRRLECQGRAWTFQTPRGEFRIRGKISNPIWRKPDWAFYEEGKTLPVDENERYEKNVLGEYAMPIGDGYFIHGTLYNRMLGRNVTHGCVRLGSADLIRLANAVPTGTKVYIF